MTITSKSAGRLIKYIAAASTNKCSTLVLGNSLANRFVVTSRQSLEVSRTFALSTEHSLFFLAFAKLAAILIILSISYFWYIHKSDADSFVRSFFPKYIPPVSSRITSRSISLSDSSFSGEALDNEGII